MKFIVVMLFGCLSNVLNAFGMSANNYFQQIYNAASDDTRSKFDQTTEFIRKHLSDDLVDDNYLKDVKEAVAELSIEISNTLSDMVNIPYRIMCEANKRNYHENLTKSRLEIVYMNAEEYCGVPIFVCGGYALSGCKKALGILSAKLGDYGANQLYDKSKWQPLMDRIFYLAENKFITREDFYTHVRPYVGLPVADAIYGDNGVPFTIPQN